MTIVFYTSGHGFGHASRDIELANALLRRRPDLKVRFRTAVPRWLFDLSADGNVAVDAFEADTGVAQIDSLRIDEEATVRRASAFYTDFDPKAAAEAEWLRRSDATLVIGDIPPIAFAGAARAGVPAIAVGNFTWDWIYEAYDGFPRTAPHVVPTIRAANANADIALRLPLHGGFEGMRVRDIPFIARKSRRDAAGTRDALGIRGDRPIVLASFGAYGASLPLEEVASAGALTIVQIEPDARRSANARLLRFDERDLYARGYRYEDLVAAADVVITKPGYGIVSECAANDTAMLYTSRGRFVEYDVFVAQMPALLRCRFIAGDDLLAGRWEESITALLAQPAPPKPCVDGAAVAADAIMNIAASR